MRTNRTSRNGKRRIALYLQKLFSLYSRTFTSVKNNLRAHSLPSRALEQNHSGTTPPPPSPDEQKNDLQCSVAVEQNVSGREVLTIKICGRIRADKPGQRTNLKVTFDDVTEGDDNAEAVYAKSYDEKSEPPRVFEYICDLGRLNDTETKIHDWLSVAKIETGWMLLARKGTRRLRLTGLVICRQTYNKLAQCQCTFEYDNPHYGYLDLTENTERSNALAVTLAFALSAADGRMYKSEIEKIKDWACRNIDSDSSRQNRRQLEKALNKTIKFFKKGYTVDTEALSLQLAQIAPAEQRYGIIELCLSVAGSKGFISAQQVEMLKKLITWLDIEPDRFRKMFDRLIPAHTHNIGDLELVFGLNEQMDSEQTRQRLNNEYRKWNARVTSMNPDIRNQARHMLELIAEARGRYIQ